MVWKVKWSYMTDEKLFLPKPSSPQVPFSPRQNISGSHSIYPFFLQSSHTGLSTVLGTCHAYSHFKAKSLLKYLLSKEVYPDHPISNCNTPHLCIPNHSYSALCFPLQYYVICLFVMYIVYYLSFSTGRYSVAAEILSPMNPKHLGQCWAHNSHSTNLCWIIEKIMNEQHWERRNQTGSGKFFTLPAL